MFQSALGAEGKEALAAFLGGVGCLLRFQSWALEMAVANRSVRRGIVSGADMGARAVAARIMK